METATISKGIYRGYMGIMEKQMESEMGTTILS